MHGNAVEQTHCVDRLHSLIASSQSGAKQKSFTSLLVHDRSNTTAHKLERRRWCDQDFLSHVSARARVALSMADQMACLSEARACSAEARPKAVPQRRAGALGPAAHIAEPSGRCAPPQHNNAPLLPLRKPFGACSLVRRPLALISYSHP